SKQCSTSTMLNSEASPKAISERASYLQVRLEFHLYPHLIPAFFNIHGFGPPVRFTAPSTWTWVGHLVSGLRQRTISRYSDSLSLRLRTFLLTLARSRNSPVHSTKGTPSLIHELLLLVVMWFQELFPSPPGVLFTFPSRYWFTIGH